jgi:hypothetical protein
LFDIGGNLAAARKGQGLGPSDVERLTLLRGRYLAALEHNEFEALPGRVYARAFLRTYADALGLDADRFVDEFDARYPEPELEPPPAVIRPRRTFRVRPGFALGGIVLAACGGAIAWNALSSPPKLTPIVHPPAAKAASSRAHLKPASRPPKPVAPQHAALVIRAKAGPCWLLVRRGGPAGIVLFEGTLETGKSMHFAPRVWVRLGAPWNVDVQRGAHVVRGLPATTPVNITA